MRVHNEGVNEDDTYIYILSRPKQHHKITIVEEYESFVKFYHLSLNPVS